MVNVAGSIPQSERYTYWYDENRNGIDDGPEEHSMIDHMYVSRGLAETSILRVFGELINYFDV